MRKGEEKRMSKGIGKGQEKRAQKEKEDGEGGRK